MRPSTACFLALALFLCTKAYGQVPPDPAYIQDWTWIGVNYKTSNTQVSTHVALLTCPGNKCVPTW